MYLDLTPLDATLLPPMVARVAGPTAQPPAKLMAARGLAPLGPKDLVTALYQLSHDPDPKISAAAKETAASLPDNILGAALEAQLDARVLHFLAGFVTDRSQLVEKVLLNRCAHDATLAWLAGALGESELEILAGNQERLLACPAIIEALYFNKQARMSTVERLLELAVRNGLTLDRVPHFKDIAASILGAPPAARDPSTAATEDAAFAAAMNEAGDAEAQTALEESEESQENLVNLTRTPLKDVPKLSLVKKVRLASLGNSMHRALLIRDPNRTVALAAIEAGGVSEQEAARYAANRSLPEEVIREITKRKDWQKNYLVKMNLVNNPKCPLAHAMHLLPHLRPSDLRALVRSKNISSALANAAKEMLRKKS
jgi:hypothetical protein